MIKPTECTNHRVVLTSSEMIWDNKWQNGEPISQRNTFNCHGECKYEKVVEFKMEKPRD